MFEESDSESEWESEEGRPGSTDWRSGFVDHADPPCSPANTDPSGWVALELDAATADAAELADPDLIDALIGLDRMASWAAARQARLLAESARHPPRQRPVRGHLRRGSGRPAATPPTRSGWPCACPAGRR